jgi:hypothetical protein
MGEVSYDNLLWLKYNKDFKEINFYNRDISHNKSFFSNDPITSLTLDDNVIFADFAFNKD